MSEVRECNKVEKIIGRIFSVKEFENATIFRVAVGGGKIKDSDDYIPSLWVTVIAPYNSCEFDTLAEVPIEEWEKKYIEISGSIKVDGFVNKKNEVLQEIKIFATEIVFHEFEEKETPKKKPTPRKRTTTRKK